MFKKILGIILGLILIGLYLFSYINIFKVSGGAMMPTLKDGQTVVFLKTSVAKLHRGDIVLFKSPVMDGDYPAVEAPDYVARIIGIPGESFMIENGELNIKIDGQSYKYAESYLSPNTKLDTTWEGKWFTIPGSHFFILTDTRNAPVSIPGKFVPASNIHGVKI